MAYTFDKKTGQITIGEWEKGIATSPHNGIGDLKGVNISSIAGEVSVAYNRSRLDQAQVIGQTLSVNGVSTTFAYSSVLTVGTWILVNSHTGSPGTIDGHYYLVKPIISGTSYTLWSDFGVTQITSGGTGTINFTTLTMGVPIDWTAEQSTSSAYRYYILDSNGIIWVNGSASVLGSSFIAGGLTTATTWAAITPHGTSTGSVDTFTSNQGSLQIMYATDTNNIITASYLLIFTSSQIKQGANNTGWPSLVGSDFAVWQSLNYQSASSHKSILGVDQVIYFCDGPGIGIIEQAAGKQFNPGNAATYTYKNANYLMSPTDAANRIAMLPVGNGLSIVVGGIQQNIYVYPTYQNSTATGAAPNSIMWMQESNVQYMVQANNYVIIFTGSKGNIYLTNGSSVVKIEVVPDYITSSVNFVQDPYFVWGGAMYLRGRVFFSIKDQTASHAGNCGGIWSFIPSFSYYPDQDEGLSLRMESASSLYSTFGFNGYAPVIFAGIEITSQQANGPQYIACWTQTSGVTTTNSIDFSGTQALTNGSSIIETDVIPVGTFLEPKTFNQIEAKFAANLVSGESIAINYRTDLSQAWASAGTINSETVATSNGSPLSRIVQDIPFQAAQIIQLQVVLTSTVTNPSWCRLKELYIR